MLFKYPQLLWALLLLLLPILVHLLQLRKFKNTPFTNVKLLQKVVAKSQRSQSLKRWLLLFTRMALFASLIFAFTQPFMASTTALQEQEMVIYLDNSHSLQLRKDNSSLLDETIQEFIDVIPREAIFTLFTNDEEFKDVTIKDIQNTLLQLPFSSNQLTLEDILLKSGTFFNQRGNTVKKLVIFSDFQKSMAGNIRDSINEIEKYFVPLRVENMSNISIDSLYIETGNSPEKNLVVLVSGSSEFESTPISAYNGESLIAKSAVKYNPDGKSKIVFTLPAEEEIKGRVSISDMGLAYDNELFFNINTREKIKVLALGTGDDLFLRKLFSDDRSEYISENEEEQAISLLASQDLLILNELASVSTPLETAIKDYLQLGGSMLVIPSRDMIGRDFNSLLSGYGFSYGAKVEVPQEITGINYAHPLFVNVFKDRIENFQYPNVTRYYTLNGNASEILSYANGAPFMASKEDVYVFTASLNIANSNFKSSPLVVPSIYATALQSRKLAALYYSMGRENSIDIPELMQQDKIISVQKEGEQFIPMQRSVGQKTRLWFSEYPKEPGTYELNNTEQQRSLSFNYSRDESNLSYLGLEAMEGVTISSSASELFNEFENANAVTSLWKWFAILALLFILTEVIIQKVLT
ncbi:MAG: hypothetical protein HKP53_01875 [Eudoraea sp.]|nr:hypothetical protein [Eudoraea sp.]